MSICHFKMSNGRFWTHFVKKTFEMCRHQNMQMQSRDLGLVWERVWEGLEVGFNRILKGF